MCKPSQSRAMSDIEVLWFLIFFLLTGMVIEALAVWGLLKRVEKLEDHVRDFEKIEHRVEATELRLSL